MRRDYLSIVLFIGLIFLAIGCVSRPPASRLQTVLFPDVKLEPDEYIQSVEISITGGRVESVNHLIDDWNTEVDWDNPGLKVVKLQAGHFVSGLASVHKLDGFITVVPGGSYFDIQATLFTQSPDPTGRVPRVIVLSREQLILTPQPPK